MVLFVEWPRLHLPTMTNTTSRAERSLPCKFFSSLQLSILCFSAPISKIGSLIRGKTDVNSTSALYPTKEEVRLWQHSFECLLRDKYGKHLFRQFVIREVSSENLDFYEDVEEFKKLKPGKKSTIQRANEIYSTYFKEGAPKEVRNWDISVCGNFSLT